MSKYNLIVRKFEDPTYKEVIINYMVTSALKKILVRHEGDLIMTMCFNILIASRFTKATSNLLLCMACLNPDNSFSSFNKEKLIKLAKRYPLDFSEIDIRVLENKFDVIFKMKSGVHFTGITEVGHLAKKQVKTKKIDNYPWLYRLIKLVLIIFGNEDFEDLIAQQIWRLIVERLFGYIHREIDISNDLYPHDRYQRAKDDT
ncbi:hypothetical protein LXL04_008576 [Taraxacum kok-saghyz]